MNESLLVGRRILIVEDDWMIAQDVAEMLERAGVTIAGPAPSVERASALFNAEQAIDAAVLDVNLGSEDSFPVAAMLRKRGIPFLFSTGYNSADIPSEWSQVTAVAKPLQLSSVEALLRDAPL